MALAKSKHHMERRSKKNMAAKLLVLPSASSKKEKQIVYSLFFDGMFDGYVNY
jgi:hypothetical protein